MNILNKLRFTIGCLVIFLCCGAWGLSRDLVPERGDVFTFSHDGKPSGYNFIQYGPLRNPTTGKFLKDKKGNEIWGKIPSGLPPVDGRSCRLVFKESHKNVNLPATGNPPYRAMLARSAVEPMPPTPELGQLYSHRYALSGSDHVQAIECFLKESAPLDFFQILGKFGLLRSNGNAINIQRGAWEPWEEQAQAGNLENVARAYLDRMFGLGEADARHIDDGPRNTEVIMPMETIRGTVPRLPSADL
ncbi:MAG: hypothetical protein A2X86_00135 [Bdellovibrionales bacterium GWA2_49_15]|nr:MAG: hypothetical protein A2X86_00135 [Bdellovibrionales bacterium GWA2_49_15]HAZ14450.1 hypothetical protein [Bdellovibrionales bacterium]